jgi:hypothetical protein
MRHRVAFSSRLGGKRLGSRASCQPAACCRPSAHRSWVSLTPRRPCSATCRSSASDSSDSQPEQTLSDALATNNHTPLDAVGEGEVPAALVGDDASILTPTSDEPIISASAASDVPAAEGAGASSGSSSVELDAMAIEAAAQQLEVEDNLTVSIARLEAEEQLLVRREADAKVLDSAPVNSDLKKVWESLQLVQAQLKVAISEEDYKCVAPCLPCCAAPLHAVLYCSARCLPHMLHRFTMPYCSACRARANVAVQEVCMLCPHARTLVLGTSYTPQFSIRRMAVCCC